MEIAGRTLKDWANYRYEFVINGQAVGNYSAWDVIQMLDIQQIGMETMIRTAGHPSEPKRLADSLIIQYAPALRPLNGAPIQVMILDSLEKLRVRFLWFSIGVGLILLGFFLSGIRVYVAQ